MAKMMRTGYGEAGQNRRYGWTTDDKLTERIFRNIEDVVPIDEIDTLPDVQERLRVRLKRGAGGLSTVSEVNTVPDSAIEGQEEVSSQAEIRRLAAAQLPTGIGQTVQAQGFFIWCFFDNVRWWLLYPGRLELLLWFIGVFVLICVTVFFMLALIVSLGLLG